MKNFISHTVGSLNILGTYIYYVVDKIISNDNLLKTIIIAGVVIYIIREVDIIGFIERVSSITLGDFTMSVNEAKNEKQKDEENIQNLKYENNKDKEEIRYLEIKSELIQLLIDNNKLVNLIELVISGKRNIKIPLHLIPREYTLKEISKIFEYKIYSNTIRVISINKDVEPILIDAYNDLKQKGIIYETIK